VATPGAGAVDPGGHLRDGQAFGRYQIVRMLGEGGMGAVYEALHTGLKKRVALKTLLPSIAKSAEAQARFLREGEAASRINHPNVVDVTDVGTHDGIPYLVMEYLVGETLGDFMRRQGALEIEHAVDLFLPVLSAVAAGHDQGVIHRDLKPQNIFLGRGIFGDRVPKILDFGVSKILGGDDPALTGTSSVLGTASYMSPEQARGAKVVDARSDQYALGLIFYEMLTGKRAHVGDSPLEVLHTIAIGTVLDPRAMRPDLPVALEATLMRMLAKEPAARHESLRSAARDVMPFASERARLTYRQAFDESVDVAHPTGTMAIPGARGGGTMLLDDVASAPPAGASGAAGRTKMLPEPPADTTLGQGATEPRAVPVSPRGGKRVAIGVALAAGVIAAVIVARRSGHAPIAEPAEPAAAPRGAPAAELPRPPSPPAQPVAPAPIAPSAAPAASAPAPIDEGAARPAHAREKQGAAHGDVARETARENAPHTHHAKKTVAPAQEPKRLGANNAPILE
jgi:eukaryotic-like serine/threonine-protein kinase